VRGKQATALSTDEFCTVQVLKEPKNSGVSAFQGLQCMTVNGTIRTGAKRPLKCPHFRGSE